MAYQEIGMPGFWIIAGPEITRMATRHRREAGNADLPIGIRCASLNPHRWKL
jgi:hypothetical protein